MLLQCTAGGTWEKCPTENRILTGPRLLAYSLMSKPKLEPLPTTIVSIIITMYTTITIFRFVFELESLYATPLSYTRHPGPHSIIQVSMTLSCMGFSCTTFKKQRGRQQKVAQPYLERQGDSVSSHLTLILTHVSYSLSSLQGVI